jgi:hypothetical protein
VETVDEWEMYSAEEEMPGRSPGQYARDAVVRLRLRTLVSLGVLAVVTALAGREFGLGDRRFLASEVVLLMGMFVTLRYVVPVVERWDRGAEGEEEVGGLLDEMVRMRGEEGWRVIHDGSFGRGNVDHIVIGPAGIFAVETKSHPGPVRVGRIHGSVLRQADAEARGVEAIVGLPVEPLIVFSRAWVDRPLSRRKGVRVVPGRMLVGFLGKLRPALSEGEMRTARERLAQALEAQGARDRRHLLH